MKKELICEYCKLKIFSIDGYIRSGKRYFHRKCAGLCNDEKARRKYENL